MLLSCQTAQECFSAAPQGPASTRRDQEMPQSNQSQAERTGLALGHSPSSRQRDARDDDNPDTPHTMTDTSEQQAAPNSPQEACNQIANETGIAEIEASSACSGLQGNVHLEVACNVCAQDKVIGSETGNDRESHSEVESIVELHK